MGEQEIRDETGSREMRTFVKALLDDVRALERILAEGLIETGVRRIGAEQEVCVTDEAGRPANLATGILEDLDDDRFCTELGLFNLEINLSPREFSGPCLAAMETELRELLSRARRAARARNADLVLCGILPTLEKVHLGLGSMTPSPRYAELNRTLRELRGGEFRTLIKGLDELQITHDNVMLEACNTSFQVHFQVGSDEFPRLYNLAQAVTAPVLAAAVNSPLLLQKRLWQETRVALFQQSLDTRSEAMTQRGGRTRVTFGDEWVRESVLEIFKSDIARFRALIAAETEQCSLETLERGEIPQLKALCLHNGTVYRWNRPCYGVKDGTAHLRIENRVLPAGPTVADEIANAAFFFGLLAALGDEYGDITRVMSFDDAKSNFMAAARYGLDANFTWIQGNSFGAPELIREHLLPMAREGLVRHAIPEGEADHYLSLVEKRVAARRTGAQWALDSLARMAGRGSADDRCRALVRAMLRNQARGVPAHAWENAAVEANGGRPDSCRTVGQIMTRDLFTVHPEDVIDLAASLMDWEHIRHVPVEDHEGNLVGLLSHRSLLRILARQRDGAGENCAVREVMRRNPVTVMPETPCLEAIETMKRERLGCLPVVEDRKLVGIVTEKDFITLAGGLLDEWLRGES